MLSHIGLQLIVMLSGIILPRFFLKEYGSAVNGLVSSISQFLTYLGLAEAGVGSASMVALYGPIASNNKEEINGILAATKKFYNKSGRIFVCLLLALVCVYPIIVSEQIDTKTVRLMIIILASSTLVDFFFVGKYKVFLTASQNGYIISNIQAVGTILNVAVSIVLIYYHVNVLVVKGSATLIYILRFIIVRYYAEKVYPWIDFNVTAKDNALKQRVDVLLHQIVGVIVNNTDIVLLTFLLGNNSLKEVSVYTIYNMVSSSVNGLLNSFSNALTAGFGDVISSGEEETLKRSYSNFEYLYFIVVFSVAICMGVLILPFVEIYTRGVTDVNYVRSSLAVLFTLVILVQNIRIPSITIITAAGHFSQTRRQAVLEAGINLTVSLVLINRLGIVGVLLGTVCSYAYRTTESIGYTAKKLVKRTGTKTFYRLVRNGLVAGICLIIGTSNVPRNMSGYVEWMFYAIGVGVCSCILLIIVNVICEKDEACMLKKRIYNVLKTIK